MNSILTSSGILFIKRIFGKTAKLTFYLQKSLGRNWMVSRNSINITGE